MSVAYAKPRAVENNGKTYYVVSSADEKMDSGKEVCEAMGGQCVGYTNFSNDICAQLHPDAKATSDENGEKAGVYCDGPPQEGLCSWSENECHMCPTCGVGLTCSDSIGTLYREMYVECSGVVSMDGSSWWDGFTSMTGRWWSSLRDAVQRAFDRYRGILDRLMKVSVQKHVVIQVDGPDGSVSADVPTDSLVCEFYQQNKKLASCGAVGAADTFCVNAFGSRFARAALCQENGVIICSKPCTTSPQEVKPPRCAFDGDRPRGNQAPPLDFCTETITVDTTTVGTKKAGEVCQHGGECATGYCLGQPSDSGIKYFCSCSQTRHDTSCGR
jgi:hypothetical protein